MGNSAKTIFFVIAEYARFALLLTLLFLFGMPSSPSDNPAYAFFVLAGFATVGFLYGRLFSRKRDFANLLLPVILTCAFLAYAASGSKDPVRFADYLEHLAFYLFVFVLIGAPISLGALAGWKLFPASSRNQMPKWRSGLIGALPGLGAFYLLVIILGFGLAQYHMLYDCARLGGLYDFARCHCNIAILYRAKDGDLAGIQKELNAGTDIDTIDSLSVTALGWAMRMGQSEAARLLIEKGANPNTIDFDQLTPLMYASSYSPDLIKLLVSRAARLEVRSERGWTALSMASWNANPETVKALLSLGANPNTRDNNGHTPLQIAVMELKALENVGSDRKAGYREVIGLLSDNEPLPVRNIRVNYRD